MQAPDAARRALQDYTSMHGYFTQSVWDILLAANKPVSERSEALFQHLFTLGLRNPSESTLGMMTGLLCVVGTPPQPFQAYSLLQTVKSSWKTFCNRQGRFNPGEAVQLGPLLLTPQHVMQWQQASGQLTVPCPLTVAAIQRAASGIPLRKPRTGLQWDAVSQMPSSGQDLSHVFGAFAATFVNLFKTQSQQEQTPRIELLGTRVPQEGRGSQEGTAQAVTQPALPAGAVQQASQVPPSLLALQDAMPAAAAPSAGLESSASPAAGPQPSPAHQAEACAEEAEVPKELAPAGSFEANRAKLAALLEARDKQKGKQVRKGKPAAAPACLAAASKVSALSSAQLSVPAAKKPAGLVKRRPSAVDTKKQTQKKGVQPKCTKETADTRKKSASRAYHQARNLALKRGLDDDRAKKAGRKATQKPCSSGTTSDLLASAWIPGLDHLCVYPAADKLQFCFALSASRQPSV